MALSTAPRIRLVPTGTSTVCAVPLNSMYVTLGILPPARHRTSCRLRLASAARRLNPLLASGGARLKAQAVSPNLEQYLYLVADLEGACSRDDPKGAFDAPPTVRSRLCAGGR